MNIKEKALKYAIEAHKGQYRKSEKDKPMIIHPISVGMLLEEYNYDDNVICAGYLHDVVEDTPHTFQDIENEFGKDIASLVYNASEPDKSLSWEERKIHTIETIKTASLRSKVIVCADKINNLEDLMIHFFKTGKKDFSFFKRGEEKQKWYYTSIYESLITNENPNLPIFKRLRKILDILFEENISFSNKLKKILALELELINLKKVYYYNISQAIIDNEYIIKEIYPNLEKDLNKLILKDITNNYFIIKINDNEHIETISNKKITDRKNLLEDIKNKYHLS